MFPWRRKNKKPDVAEVKQGRMDTDTTRAGRSSEKVFDQRENRLYLKDLPDLFPRDMQEVNRLDFQHYIVKSTMRGNFLAPLQQPAAILDVGCGTGRWATEMAQMYPSAKVFALDVDPLMGKPSDVKLPANYQFVEGNILKVLPYPDQCFDFVHQQLLSGSLPAASWPHVVRELVRVTRQGGWIELVETDIYMQNMGPQLQQMTTWCVEACTRMGINLRLGTKLQQDLQAVGLGNIHARRLDIPLGNWGGRIGNTTAIGISSLYEALKPMILSQLRPLTAEQYEKTLQAAMKEMEQTRSTASFYIAYGQRLNNLPER